MTCKKFVVRPGDDSGWVADLEVRVAGPYTTRDLALEVAIAKAGLARAAKQPVCVIVEDARGEVLAARCICEQIGNLLGRRQFL